MLGILFLQRLLFHFSRCCCLWPMFAPWGKVLQFWGGGHQGRDFQIPTGWGMRTYCGLVYRCWLCFCCELWSQIPSAWRGTFCIYPNFRWRTRYIWLSRLCSWRGVAILGRTLPAQRSEWGQWGGFCTSLRGNLILFIGKNLFDLKSKGSGRYFFKKEALFRSKESKIYK